MRIHFGASVSDYVGVESRKAEVTGNDAETALELKCIRLQNPEIREQTTNSNCRIYG